MPRPLFLRNPGRLPEPVRTELKASGVKPRLTFVFHPIGVERALKVLQADSPNPGAVKELLESERIPELLAGLNAVERLPESEKTGAQITASLRRLLGHDSYRVRRQVVLALIKHPQTSPQEWNTFANSHYFDLRPRALDALALHPLTPREILDGLSTHNDSAVRAQFFLARGVARLNELLQNIDAKQSLDPGATLAQHPKTVLKLLHALSKHENAQVREQAAELVASLSSIFAHRAALVRPGGYPWLLGSQKPLFATPYTRELISALAKVKDIADVLARDHGQNFVGITVVGSTAKGYRRPVGRSPAQSDLDSAVIALNREVVADYKKLAGGLALCLAKYVNPMAPEAVEPLPDDIRPMEQGAKPKLGRDEPSHLSFLFHGLFFGNRRLLEQHQNAVVHRISEADWESIRAHIATYETEMLKASDLFGLSDSEVERLALAGRLLRVPPDLPEMKKIFARRSLIAK